EGVRRTGGPRPIAGLRHVAGAGGRAAEEGAARAREAVGRAGRTAAGAVLGDVARAGGRPADGARGLEGVGRTCRRRAGAVLRDVAGAGGGPADDRRRLEGIGRAGRARPVARLVDVARACRSPAHGAGVPGGVLARIARAIAGVRRARIAVVRAPGAGAHLGVARAGRARARAVLGGIALPRGGAAHDEARQEAVRRTGTARPVACLVHVAGAGRRAADRARVPRGVLAGVVRPVAGVGGARVAVVRTQGA